MIDTMREICYLMGIMFKYFLSVIILLLIWTAEASAQADLPATPTGQADVITPAPVARPNSLVYVVPIKGEIMDRGIAYFVHHAVERAKEDNAALIIFEIDTPGGAVGEGEEYTMGICASIQNASPISTVAYVTQWAMSAGSLISISADKIIMRSGSVIGAAEVIAGGSNMAEHQGKFTQAIAKQFKSIAQKKGYPPNLAMAMVDRNLEVKEVIVDGKKEFLTPQEIQELPGTRSIEIIKTVTTKDQPLALSALDAKDYGFASAILETRAEIPPFFGINNPTFKQVTPTWSEALVMYITSPVVSSILILAGLLAAWMALKMPGFGVPEITAIVCFGLVFFGHYLVGLAQATDVLIFILGLGLVAVEILLLPGFAIFGVTGAILMVAGLILSMQGFVIPDIKTAPWQVEILQRNLITVGLAFATAFALFIIFIRYLKSVPVFHKLILSAEVRSESGFVSVAKDDSALVGTKAIVFSTLRPAGKITLLDSRGRETDHNIDAVTEGNFIDKGEMVVITEVDGSRIVVEKISN
jgi:membrane-bound serine protease (ClpP class)